MPNGQSWPRGGVIKIFINADKAKVLLTIRNRTQKEAAEKIGITPEHFSRLMAGKCQPSAETRKAITRIFIGVPWDDIFIMQTTTTGEI